MIALHAIGCRPFRARESFVSIMILLGTGFPHLSKTTTTVLHRNMHPLSLSTIKAIYINIRYKMRVHCSYLKSMGVTAQSSRFRFFREAHTKRFRDSIIIIIIIIRIRITFYILLYCSVTRNLFVFEDNPISTAVTRRHPI